MGASTYEITFVIKDNDTFFWRYDIPGMVSRDSQHRLCGTSGERLIACINKSHATLVLCVISTVTVHNSDTSGLEFITGMWFTFKTKCSGLPRE